MFRLRIHWFVILTAFHAITSTASSTSSQRDPETRVRLFGESLVLACTVENGTTVMWDFTPHSDTKITLFIGSSRSTAQPADNRFQVDFNTPGASRLVINDIRLTDAGLYRCLVSTKQSGLVTKPVADLTVLEAEPACATITSYKTWNQLDDVKIRCQVNYSGTQQPFIHCRKLSTDTVPTPATPAETGNSSYRSLSITYDMDVDRITKETKFECTTSVNMKNCPHCHVHYTWRWPHVIADEVNRVETQSDSSRAVSTTTTPAGETSPTSSNGEKLVLVGILVAVFMIVILVAIFGIIHCQIARKGVLCSTHGQRCCSPGTTLSASMSGHGHMFDTGAELYSISGDIDGPAPPVPSRSPASVSESGIRTSCQVLSNVVMEHASNNEISEHAPAVNPTYAELSVSIRTDTSQRLTRSTGTSHAVYADINHFQTNNKKRTPPDTF